MKDIKLKIKYLVIGLIVFLSIFFYQSTSFIPQLEKQHQKEFGRIKLQKLSSSLSSTTTTTTTNTSNINLINQDEILNRECQYIDAVYIWFNENDSNHQRKRKEQGLESLDNSKYRNVDQLKYSLRSLNTYAPWIQNIWIVTDDKIPTWYTNEYNHKVKFVSHENVYYNRSHLPTFNRVSVESNLFNLPKEVSNCFLYFNDNVLLKSPVNPTDFFDEDFNQVLFETNNVFGSTLYKEVVEKGIIDDFYKSLFVSLHLLDKVWSSNNQQNDNNRPTLFNSVIEQGVYPINRKVLLEMNNQLSEYLQDVSSHKVQSVTTDIHIPFIYNQYVKKLSNSDNNNNNNNNKYKITQGFNFYGELSELNTIQDALDTESSVLCLKNNLNFNDEYYNQQIDQVIKYYNKILVDSAPWEK